MEKPAVSSKRHSDAKPHRPNKAWRRCKMLLAFFALFLIVVGIAANYMFSMPGHSWVDEAGSAAGAPGSVVDAEPSPLESTPLLVVSTSLENHVHHLAKTIGERNWVKYKALCRAADYVESELDHPGYQVSRQTFKVNGLDCFNIIAELKGVNSPEEIVIIGAHYDSAQGTPGANDNGSGTAAMLALAKLFRGKKLAKTLRFVGFTNEEPPYFQNEGEMGSWVYARRCRLADEKIVGVLSLETMGYFSDDENSQKYPAPLNLLYPSTGNFIGFVGDLNSRPLLRSTLKTFREHAKIPSEGASLPGLVTGVGWSDHWSFWQEGYQGLMVTDTAVFRYPHYHRASDTVDKIDFERLTKVVEGLEFVIAEMVE